MRPEGPIARCRDERQVLARAVIHDGQDPEAAAIGELVGDKVERPALV